MGLFNNTKKPQASSSTSSHPLLHEPLSDAPTSPSAAGRSSLTRQVASVRSAASTELVMDWSNIYVEIDNDANVAPRPSLQSKSFTVPETVTNGDTISNDAESGSMSNNLSQVNSGDTSGVTDGERTMEVQRTGTMNTAVSFAATSKDDSQGAFTITNNGKYLTTNDFANAQLMRWKFAAEEGPTYMQILAFLAALAALGSTIYPLVTEESYWTIPVLICAFHTIVLCAIIVVLEVRALGARNPMNVRARARTLLTRYLNILRLLWGRGCMYIFTGSMNLTIFHTYTLYTGLALIGLGCLAILIGAHASFNLERLKLSLTDDSFLWSKFESADSDGNNLIDICEFSNLVWSLGLELDDAYTYRAFAQIDKDSDARINFQEFKSWWIAVQDDEYLQKQISV
jgi:EF-hand domain pair